jgi:hypothetical protein
MRPPPHFVLERWDHLGGRTHRLHAARHAWAVSALRGTLRYGVGVPLILLALAVLVAGATPTSVGGAAMLGGCGLVALLLGGAGHSREAHRGPRSRRDDALRFLSDRKP